MKQLKLETAETIGSSETEEVVIKFTGSGRTKENVMALLNLVSVCGGWGTSRMVGVLDYSSSEELRKREMSEFDVYLDGDGSDRIKDILVNGVPLKEAIEFKDPVSCCDGTYEGLVSGYEYTWSGQGKSTGVSSKFKHRSEDFGVRGFNIPATITIKDGKVLSCRPT